MRWLAISLTVLALLVASRDVPAAEPPAVTFPAPPRVATTATELAAIRAAPDFPAVRAAAAAAGDRWLANPPTLPDGYGSWIFYYACPDDGTPLHALSPDRHECPKCKKVYSDERTIAAYRSTLHSTCELAAEALAWAYAYTGDDKYVAGVKRVLLKFADDYASYPGRLDRWGHTGFFAPLGGRRYVQSLDEAVGATHLTKAYDLTRISLAWSDAERKHVEDDFFRATAASLLRFNQDINNHQTWYNAGLIDIASVLGDASMVNRVLTMRGGVEYQLEHSIGRDGLWYEGALAYHNYALQPMTEIADTARRLGLDVASNPKLRLMILGPLHAAYPDGSFPVVNDSDPGTIAMFNWAFAWGWKNYRDPLMAQALAHGNLTTLQAMLGPGARVEWPLQLGSEALADAGLAFLRRGAGAGATCVMLKYGPHGGDAGGHGHYDKLNICLYANGREWLLDPGRLTYSHREYKTWVKETAAHNTVTLGGRTQNATTGRLLWLKEGEGWSACAAESRGAYPGAVLRRYLLLTDKMLVDVFEVSAGAETQIDWLIHSTAQRVEPVNASLKSAAAPPLGDHDGYQHLTQIRAFGAERSGSVAYDFLSGNDAALPRLRVWLGEEGKTYSAFGIGYAVEQKTPSLIRRRTAANTTFTAVYDLSGDGRYVTEVSGFPDSIDTIDGKWSIHFAPDGITIRRAPAPLSSWERARVRGCG